MQFSFRLQALIPVILFWIGPMINPGSSTGPVGYNREIGSKWMYLNLQHAKTESSRILPSPTKHEINTAAFTHAVSTTTKRSVTTTSRALYHSTAKSNQQIIRTPEEKNLCGVAKAKPLHSPYVIGGIPANAFEFPWFSAITKYQYNANPQWKVVCGASLINSKYAITAAHCLHGRYKDTLQVVFNLRDTTNITHTAARWETRRRIARFVIHPTYNSRTQHDDIALIEFKEPIDYLRRDKNLAPICLPENSSETFASQNATFIGFGHTSYGSSSPGPKENSRILMKVQVPILSHKECMKSKVPTKKNITENMICAGDHGKDACINDSGGPLMVHDRSRTVLVGISSWGIGCALKDYPGIYTRITGYLQWIKTASSK